MLQDLENYVCVVVMGQNCSSFLHSIWVVGVVEMVGVGDEGGRSCGDGGGGGWHPEGKER